MRLGISQSNYLPWAGYFKLISHVDFFIFYDSVQYTKNDWRNRNKIVRNGSVEWLTIPVTYSFSKKSRIDEILLPDGNWREIHIERLQQAYANSLNFNLLQSQLFKDLRAPIESLSELNQTAIRNLCQLLGIKTELKSNITLNNSLEKSERLVNLCHLMEAETYVTTPKALQYLNLDLFYKSGIEVEILDFSSCTESYPQKTNIFDPYVSVVDLLANLDLAEATSRINR